MKRLTVMCLLSVLLVFVLGFPLLKAVIPSGATPTPISNETAQSDTPGSHGAIAGNVTEMDLTGYTTTQAWAAYYGNVSGTVQLADNNDYIMYNWTLASPEGEVYASTNDSIQWATISCFNFTATGVGGVESAQAGQTSLTGMNLSTLEANFNITWNDVDGVNETFGMNGALPGNDGYHDEFFVNALNFTVGECLSANTFRDSAKGPTDNYFEEILLFDTTTQSVIFTTLLEEDDTPGFDGEYHDFQMLVLDDGHFTNTAPTTYYFYVEIE